MQFTDRRKWCQRCGSLEDVRLFSASGAKFTSGKAWLCESCTRDVFAALRLILANQTVTVEPVAVIPPPELPEFPDDMGDEPLYCKGARVIPAGRDDPRLPSWTGGAHLAPEPAIVESVRRWSDGGLKPPSGYRKSGHMADIDQLWVYHLRTADGTFTGPQSAYQLVSCDLDDESDAR